MMPGIERRPRLGAIGIAALLVFTFTRPAHALDVRPWERVLRAHARSGGMDYAGLRADAARRRDLDAFAASLGAMPEGESLAVYLNAYNALVVKAIVDRPGLASVRDVPGFFDRIPHRIAGKERTLDALENDVLRARFRDARVHAALVCGAVSCPSLHPHAFVPRTLDATLDGLARAMVASDAHVRVRDGRLEVSEIFFWYASDFARDAGSVLAWLLRYDVGRRLARAPDGSTPLRIPYRWALNQR